MLLVPPRLTHTVVAHFQQGRAGRDRKGQLHLEAASTRARSLGAQKGSRMHCSKISPGRAKADTCTDRSLCVIPDDETNPMVITVVRDSLLSRCGCPSMNNMVVCIMLDIYSLALFDPRNIRTLVQTSEGCLIPYRTEYSTKAYRAPQNTRQAQQLYPYYFIAVSFHGTALNINAIIALRQGDEPHSYR